MRACAKGDNFFLGIITRCKGESSPSWSDSELKNKSLKFERSEKLMFKIPIWVKNGKFNYF